jgi:small GTP-binding protein
MFYTVVWDTAGQEKYHSLAPLYYRGASAAIIVYDICNAASFEALPTWLQRLQEFGPTTTTTTTKKDDFIRILVGNKCDLQNERQVLRERAESLALEFGCLYIESSAREDIHVEEIFQRIARLLPEDTMSCLAHDGSTGTSSRTSGGKNRSESFSNHGGIIKLAIQQQQQQQQESKSFATIRQGVCGC